MKKKTVANIAFHHKSKPKLAESLSAASLQDLVNMCVSRATTTLEGDCVGYTEQQRDQMSDLFSSFLYTHRAIRKLLSDLTSDDPESVDALALLRQQFECVFSISLMLESSDYVTAYVQDYWRKLYVKYLLDNEETGTFPEHQVIFSNSKENILRLRDYFRITAEQQATLDFEELGIELPRGVTTQKLAKFPSPGVIPDIVVHPDKKRMLERLHFEYSYLCSFSHVLGTANLLKGFFDKRSMHRQHAMATQADIKDKYETLVVVPAHIKSAICAAVAVTELSFLYPQDVDLSAIATRAWNMLCPAHILAVAVWEIRSKSVLGVIG